MVSTKKFVNGRLVTLRAGRYWKTTDTTLGPPDVNLSEPTTALLLEYQGNAKPRSGDNCWQALVGGETIVVWSSSFCEKVEK